MKVRKISRKTQWLLVLVLCICLAIQRFLLQSDLFPKEIESTNWKEASFPVAKFEAYTSPFGKRQRPCPTCSEFHKGQDIAAPSGSEIRAWWGGTIIKVGVDPDGWGNYLIILSGKWEHLYAHCRKIIVKEGQVIATATPVGEIGQTGGATGPHLHWELRYQTDRKANTSDSSQWDLVNPAQVLWRMYKAYYPSNISNVSFQPLSTPDDALETY